MIPASALVDEVGRIGGSVVLLLFIDRPPEIELDLPRTARWLVEAIREQRSEVVNELRRRYLTAAVLSDRVQ